MVLYFDPVTKQVWCEGSDSEPDSHMDVDTSRPHEEAPGGSPLVSQDFPMSDFGDDEINAAACLVSMVSPDVLSGALEVS